jgi:hypothetical protein
MPDGTTDDEANFWGYEFEKDGERYLLPGKTASGDDVNLKDILPLLPRDCERVASAGIKGTVYWFIHKPVTARFKSERVMSFRQLVNKLSSLNHSNPDHYRLLWFMVMSQMIDRSNYRICSPAGFGKDSVVDIIGGLVGKAGTIVQPTLAKLEYLTMGNKLIAVNEVVDVAGDKWEPVEQFLLDTGAHKLEVAKHSRVSSAGGKEVLNISSLSLLLLYNDIDHYNDPKKYFDFTVKEQLCDRFPPFRIHGHYTENFNEIRGIDVQQYVRDHMQEYKDILYTFTYYKENLMRELHHYKQPEWEPRTPERWKMNIGTLYKVFDLYAESQEEFDHLVAVAWSSIKDYKEMLHYPDLRKKVEEKLSHSQWLETRERLRQLKTFKEKNSELQRVLTGERVVVDHNFW